MDTSTLVAATDTLGRAVPPRRYRSVEEKRRIVAEAMAPGASVAEVARRNGVKANLVFGWRRQFEQGVLEQHTRRGAVKLVAVKVSGEPGEGCEESRGMAKEASEGRIEVTLSKDIRIAIVGAVAVERIERVLTILRRSS